MWEKIMYTCICNCTCTMMYSRKMTEHCKPAIMGKNKNHYVKKPKKKEKDYQSIKKHELLYVVCKKPTLNIKPM